MIEITNPSERLIDVVTKYANGKTDVSEFDTVLFLEADAVPELRALIEEALRLSADIEPEIVIDVDNEVLAIRLHIVEVEVK